LEPELRRSAPARWLGFGPAAVEAGVGATFAFPPGRWHSPRGARPVPQSRRPLDDHGLGKALSYADAAVLVLLHLQDQTPLDGGWPPDLAVASKQQFHIHQANPRAAVMTQGETLAMMGRNGSSAPDRKAAR
jgi:hypothetical protein